jgi:peptidoglycan/LPS O-acetylase OafA/YrhL
LHDDWHVTEPQAPLAQQARVDAGRLSFLDAVRGVAAFVVLLQHGFAFYFPSFAHFSATRFDFGRMGVALFFLTSGFIIPVSLERGGSLRRFWISRFFRLYPLYWLSLTLILLLSTVKSDVLFSNFADHIVRNTLLNITMLQELMRIPHATELYYTLTLEMIFYIACSVFFAAGVLRRSVALSATAIAVTAIAGVVFPLVVDHRAPMLGLFALTTMFFGTVVYRWVNGECSTRTMAALLGALAIVSAAGALINYDRFPKISGDHFTFMAASLPWLVAYLLFFGAVALRHADFPAVLKWLGLISYSLYLMHPIVLFSTAGWDTPPWPTFAFFVITSLAFATLTFHAVEAPFIAIGQKLRGMPARRQPPEVAAEPRPAA